MNNESEFIPNSKIRDGINIAKNNAEYFLKMAKDFHEKDDYQLSIPLAILAFEESSKVTHLDDFIKEGRHITKEEWENLRDHKFKLTAGDKKTKVQLQNESELETLARSLILRSVGLRDIVPNRNIAIQTKEKQIEVHSRLSKLKEICFYANWNENKKKWDDFSKIPASDIKLISRFILYLSEHRFHLANLTVDTLNNPFRKISNEELFDSEKSKKYLTARIEHHKNLKAIQLMIEFEQETKKKISELQKGYLLFNKYFSN